MPDPSLKPAKAGKPAKSETLTVEDWVAAATDILHRESVKGIRIDALCAKLGVTKGSFYWHFKGRDGLLKAILTSWKARMTGNIISRFEETEAHARTRLRGLLELTRRPRARKAAQVEQSIRDWARHDGAVSSSVTEVDAMRLAFFTDQFRAMGFDDQAAGTRAYIAYAVMMGDSVLRQSLEDTEISEDVLEEVIALLSQPKV